MGYPERLLSEDEVIEAQFRPHWSGIIREGLILLGGIVLSIVLAVITDLSGWVYVAIIAVAVLLTIRGLIEWWHTLHVITSERMIFRAGWIAKKGTEIPLEVIQNVAFSQTILERVFGTGDLMVESAGTHGQTRYRDIPKPEWVQSLIYGMREKRMNPEPEPEPEVKTDAPTPESIRPPGGTRDGATAAAQLEILSRLHDQGKLTDEEFESQKAKLLGGI